VAYGDVERKPAGPLKVVLKVNGTEVASGVVPVSAPLIFTANDCLDFGIDLGSPVGLEYYDQAPSSSTARSKAHTWNTSVPPLSFSRRKCKPMDPFQWRTKRPNLVSSSFIRFWRCTGSACGNARRTAASHQFGRYRRHSGHAESVGSGSI
jgi:hypothetical protein